MTEPADLQPTASFEWFRVVRAIEFGTITVGARRVSGSNVMVVCGLLAMYADTDGSNIFPSVARIAVEAEISYPQAKAVMSILRGMGLIEQTERGGGRSRKPAAYRLTVPSDLLARVKVRSPTETQARAQEVAGVSTDRDR